MSRLPNFFIVGAPKAGTTSLYHYLDQHPAVFMSAIKEPHFFADEIREEHCEPELRPSMAEFSPDMGRRHLEAQVPRMGAIGWFKRSGLWEAAARITPARLRPLIRRGLIRRPGATRMEPADRHYLVDFYREDIRKLTSLLGRDLDGWLRVADC